MRSPLFVFPTRRILRASTVIRREVFFFVSIAEWRECKARHFRMRLEWITCEPRREKNEFPMSDFRSGGKYPIE